MVAHIQRHVVWSWFSGTSSGLFAGPFYNAVLPAPISPNKSGYFLFGGTESAIRVYLLIP
jgi:hypothetical protein